MNWYKIIISQNQWPKEIVDEIKKLYLTPDEYGKTRSVNDVAKITSVPASTIYYIFKKDNVPIREQYSVTGRKPFEAKLEDMTAPIKDFWGLYNQSKGNPLGKGLPEILQILGKKYNVVPNTLYKFLERNIENFENLLPEVKKNKRLFPEEVAKAIAKAYLSPSEGGYGYSATAIANFLGVKDGTILDVIRRAGTKVRNRTEQAEIARYFKINERPSLAKIIPGIPEEYKTKWKRDNWNASVPIRMSN